jgi:cobalt-zinc-cadmium efflux system outer membrane protein
MKNVMLVWALLWLPCAQAQASSNHSIAPGPMSLEQAWQLAEQNNLALKAARVELLAAEGRSEDARALLWNNPELFGEGTHRTIPQPELTSPTVREWKAGISQPFEIAGQQGYRRAAAREEVAAARYRVDETVRQVRADVERRFVQVLSLQSRIANERSALQLIESTATFAGKRVEAGEDNRLDANFAQVEAGRARSQLAALEDQLLQARAELGEIIQWPYGALPEAFGELEARTAPGSLEAFLIRAGERAHLRALQARENAASNRLDLERAARFPDVTLGLAVAREGPNEFRENVTTLTVSVPLPLFKRNAGNIAQARADLAKSQAERQAGERDIPAAVRTLWLRNQGLEARVAAIRESVLGKLQENQRLSQRALAEGEISLAQMVLVNRQLLEARRDLIDALTELRLTRVSLDLAAGTTPTTTTR